MSTDSRARRRGAARLGLLALATTAAACGSAAPAAGRPSTTTTSPAAGSQSTTTTSPPLEDPCVVGRWTSTVGSLPQTFEGETVTLTGGGGTVISYAAGGAYAADFSHTSPYVGVSHGHRIALAVTGSASGTFTAEANLLVLVDSRTSLVVTLTADGKVVSRSHPGPRSSASYTCSHSQLTLSSGGFATRYVPAG